jgi:hypothetical protein
MTHGLPRSPAFRIILKFNNLRFNSAALLKRTILPVLMPDQSSEFFRFWKDFFQTLPGRFWRRMIKGKNT